MAARRAFVAGLRDIGPALASLFPIAVIVGLTAVEIGLTGAQAVWMAVGIYTGLAQAAMLELMAENANAAVIVLAGVLVNLRLLMYSASLAPYMERLSFARRVPYAYLLVDTVYALSYAAFESGAVDDGDVDADGGDGDGDGDTDDGDDGGGTDDRPAYYLGAGVGSWVTWQAGTLVGIFFGGVVPSGLDLQFAIPLVFVALLVPVLDDRPSVVAGGLGGGVAVLAVGLPFNLGLLVGTAVGIGAGVFAERRWPA